MRLRLAVAVMLAAVFLDRSAFAEDNRAPVEAIDMVWSAHWVGFDALSKGEHQVVAYYDANRQMSVAHRLGSAPWRYHKLDSFLGWDSHNNIAIGIDRGGFIHIVGNVHNDPIVYFRSERPWDVRSLKQVSWMVDREAESRLTYPNFFEGPDGRLYFKYRTGGSGDGNEIYNVYDEKAGWRRLHDAALVDGEGERNGYFVGPRRGPDGYFHLTWVWRETPVAASNHDISYARSRDLVHWEKSDGTPLKLPITLRNAEIAVPIGEGGGLLNGHHPFGFDAQSRVVIAYQAYDKQGESQLFVTRREARGWRTSVQVSQWTGSRQMLDQTGALATTLEVRQQPQATADGLIRVSAVLSGVRHIYLLDPKTLAPVSHNTEAVASAPARKDEAGNAFLRQSSPMRDLDPQPGEARYSLEWESLSAHRDLARAFITPPTVLTLNRVQGADSGDQ